MKAIAGGMAVGMLYGLNPGEGPNRPPFPRPGPSRPETNYQPSLESRERAMMEVFYPAP